MSVNHDFIHKLDDSVHLLLEKIRVSKHANGGGPVTWEDVVAICRDSLAGVSLATANVAPTAAQGQPAAVSVPIVSAGSV